MIPLRALSLLLARAAAAAFAVTAWVRSRRKTPEERERERRLWLTSKGRISDGTVTDVRELSLNGAGDHTSEPKPGSPGAPREAQLVIYQYDVGGVSYEASQDVTLLRQFIDLHSCRLGLPASIRYDPHNPGNSIVISEYWTGLRKMGNERK